MYCRVCTFALRRIRIQNACSEVNAHASITVNQGRPSILYRRTHAILVRTNGKWLQHTIQAMYGSSLRSEVRYFQSHVCVCVGGVQKSFQDFGLRSTNGRDLLTVSSIRHFLRSLP